MIFPDYQETGCVYHIISLTDLKKTLEEGIAYDDKVTYHTKYNGFHEWIDGLKPAWIPDWVNRRKAIFASMNYRKSHPFHSHTAILAVRIQPERCWVANENYVNQNYEPFLLQHIEEFRSCRNYLEKEGAQLLKKYWETSLSFEENLKVRVDKQEGFDAEILIFHPIQPKDIRVMYIISDHRMMTVEEWKKRFCQ